HRRAYADHRSRDPWIVRSKTPCDSYASQGTGDGAIDHKVSHGRDGLRLRETLLLLYEHQAAHEQHEALLHKPASHVFLPNKRTASNATNATGTSTGQNNGTQSGRSRKLSSSLNEIAPYK
ncbi:MAG: hypothetical protein WKG03_04405, partial [Telluria sp.]